MNHIINRINIHTLIGLVAFIQVSQASPVEYNVLLKQQNRPSVEQIKTLMNSWTPTPLTIRSDLPREKEVSEKLHFNFPHWYSLLIQGAPNMIATFEKAFPGATWAFMGRDMAILADLFEAFYFSIGQKDRVARINMSGPVLKNHFDTSLALDYLCSNGIPCGKPLKHPYIFVDAVSRHSGEQGRTLMNMIYSSQNFWGALGFSGRHELPWWINMIGLRVYTTQLAATNFSLLPNILAQYSNQLEMENSGTYYTEDNLIIYHDGRPDKSFEGANEAGYTHWTGAWHESFQSWVRSNDRVVAIPGENADSEMKEAIINFQAHVISAASDPQFLERVKESAKMIHFDFPLKRPIYSPKIDASTLTKLRAATNEQELLDILSSIQPGNLSLKHSLETARRSTSSHIYLKLVNLQAQYAERAHFISNTIDLFPSLDLSSKDLRELIPFASREDQPTLFTLALVKTKTVDQFLDLVTVYVYSQSPSTKTYEDLISTHLDYIFRNLSPNVTQTNRIISYVQPNGLLHQRIAARALNGVKSQLEYRAIQKPQKLHLFSRLTPEYRKAKADAKKRLNLSRFPIISNFF